jgi:hypothetical protein
MHARVAKFEGAESEKLKESLDNIKEQAAGGPPEGVPAKQLMILANHEEGNTLVIALFDNEADMNQGHETLNSMSPPIEGGMGNRASVELYEVAVHLEA